MAGRPRKPLERHKLEGTYRKDRHGVAVPESDLAASPLPAKPSGMNVGAAKFWDRITPELRGIARERDASALAEMCFWWAEGKRIKETLEKMVPGGKGYGSLLVSAAVAADKFAKFASQFGLTPADRAKLAPVADAGKKVAKVATRPATKLDKGGKPK